MSDEMVIRCCAPTLAALKTGSLFNCPFSSREEMTAGLRALNRSLTGKGASCGASLCWRAIWCRRLAPPENRWQAGGIGMILLLAAAVLWYSKGTKKGGV